MAALCIAGVASAAPCSHAGSIPIAPFKLVNNGKVLLEVKASGKILDEKGTVIATIHGGAITFAGSSQGWKVDGSGSVTGSLYGATIKGHFDRDDQLAITQFGRPLPHPIVVTVDHAGRLRANGKTNAAPWKVVGMRASARRALILLSLSVSLPKHAHRSR